MNFICLRPAILMFIFFSLAAERVKAEPLPQIDARKFEIKPLQKSKSGRIYLFESQKVIPNTGTILLLYDQKRPAMAFRVLKNDPIANQFIAKRVRRYDQTGELALQKKYVTIEKIADLLPSPPSDGTTIEPQPLTVTEPTEPPPPISTPLSTPVQPTPLPPEPLPTVLPHDDELDAATTPVDLSKLETLEPYDDGTGDEEFLEVEEAERLEPNKNSLSASFGYFRNASDFNSSGTLQSGIGASYARLLMNDLFINKKSPQDSLWVELGMNYYSMVNYDGVNDIYNILPFYIQLLYQLHLSKTFTLLAYGGLEYNAMTSSSNPGASVNDLQGIQPTFGAGFFYNLGPQWYLRADIGWDRMTGGLSIKW